MSAIFLELELKKRKEKKKAKQKLIDMKNLFFSQ